jgi:2,4-diaminopentanoate dehydrogenase
MKLKIAQFGLGPIGIETLKLAAAKPWAQIIGGVDINPLKIGRSLGELTGLPRLSKTRVHGRLQDLLKIAKPDVVFHTAVSCFADAFAQIEPLAREGISVVSSCEELIFPWLREPKLADKLDRICKRHGSQVVGTGVNPGFVMDLLPVCMTAMSRNVREIRIERVVDAATRREPLQRKIGSGVRPKVFSRLLKTGAAGHAGLKESLALIAHCLGATLGPIKESGEPVIASRNVRTKFLDVKKGQTCGIHQRAEATLNGKVHVVLDLRMYLGARQPHDAIRIIGDPSLNVVVEGGVAGDEATVAALVNTTPLLLRAQPGLQLVTDLPVPRWSPTAG